MKLALSLYARPGTGRQERLPSKGDWRPQVHPGFEARHRGSREGVVPRPPPVPGTTGRWHPVCSTPAPGR